MKVSLLFAAALIISAAFGANIAGAEKEPATPSNLQKAKTADDAWKQILAQIPKSLEESEGLSTKLVESLTSFIEQFPKDSRVSMAKIMRAQMSLVITTRKKGDVTPVVEELRALTVDPSTTVAAGESAHLVLLQYFATYGTATDLEKEIDTWGHDYPKQPVPILFKMTLAKKLQDSNPEKAKKLMAEVENERNETLEKQAKLTASMNKILDQIKFTAVDGTVVDIQKMNGKVVLVDFWATWCGPCMREIPKVVAAYKKYHDRGFEVVGISFDENKEALLKTIQDKEMVWPQYFDGKGWENEFGKKFGIHSIPQMWLVDKKGVLVDLKARNDLEEKVAKLIDQ